MFFMFEDYIGAYYSTLNATEVGAKDKANGYEPREMKVQYQ